MYIIAAMNIYKTFTYMVQTAGSYSPTRKSFDYIGLKDYNTAAAVLMVQAGIKLYINYLKSICTTEATHI